MQNKLDNCVPTYVWPLASSLKLYTERTVGWSDIRIFKMGNVHVFRQIVFCPQFQNLPYQNCVFTCRKAMENISFYSTHSLTDIRVVVDYADMVLA